MEGKQPELESEVTKLGLAYELVTPYTSFLAVPEKELTPAQRLTLAEGRAERTDALAQDSGAAALSRRRMPPGDPILTVAAPTDAVQVTAYFRFGLVRDLKWDARLERWTVRFLVPKGTPDGEYDVPVLIVLPDGSMTVEMARYVVDSREPGFSVTATRVKGGVRVRVETAELSRRAVAVLGKTRVELRGDGRAFEGLLRGASAGRLRVVVADLARNEGEREVLIP
jgi:Ca-activated chloride channel family protein